MPGPSCQVLDLAGFLSRQPAGATWGRAPKMGSKMMYESEKNSPAAGALENFERFRMSSGAIFRMIF